MATFNYKAKTHTGQVVSGVLTAESQQVALRMLDDRALFPIMVVEGGEATKATITGRRKKVRLKILTTFYSQLADLLKAGVPVLRSLEVLSRQESNPLLTEILKEVHQDVSNGETLADSMAKHPNAFDELSVAMVRAGEEGGFLEDVLFRISSFIERKDELRNKLVGSLIYPCILLFAGLVVVLFLMVAVVPKIKEFLTRVEKPWITDVLFSMTDFFVATWKYELAIGFLGLLILIPILRNKKFQMGIDRLKLRMPVMGKIVTMIAVCRFCRILGTMLHNGVPILQALKISKDSAGNHILAEEIDKATENVQRGESLAIPLGNSGMFPLDIVDMIAVAEESNNLENVLVQIAESNEARTARAIDLGVRMLEPLLLMVMAVMVLIIAVALLVPILKMSTAVG